VNFAIYDASKVIVQKISSQIFASSGIGEHVYKFGNPRFEISKKIKN
jgi:hypothetical protein